VRITVGCDHRGLAVKELILKYLTEVGQDSEDFGCDTTEAVDYPDIAKRVAEAVAGSSFDRGILICNTGIGMSIAANKVKGIRAALCRDTFSACRARQHNDANVLCVGTEAEPDVICEIVEAFLTTEFEGGRHLKRVNKLKAMEA
jgi:ribose 5-phosphate isomerase B